MPRPVKRPVGKKPVKRLKRDWTCDPNLIATIQQDIGAVGLVAEEQAGLLTYATGTSRLLSDPNALIIRGPSSAGKTTIPDKVSRLFPDEVVIRATSVTPQALYYGEEGWLRNKWLLMGEVAHAADPDYTAAIRQLISEKKISKVVTITGQGPPETRLIEQEGPVAYTETTTKTSMFGEDLNRKIQVMVDDSPEQTRRVMRAVAGRYVVGKSLDVDDIVKRHHEFQKAMESRPIKIPFAVEVAEGMPAAIQSRRVIQQVLSTIESITLLHQFQRRLTGEYLEATAEDYQIARGLLLRPLESAILGKSIKEAYDTLKKFVAEGEFKTTDIPIVTQAQQKKGRVGYTNQMTLNRHLKKLETVGVLTCVRRGRSHEPAVWRWRATLQDTLLPPL